MEALEKIIAQCHSDDPKKYDLSSYDAKTADHHYEETQKFLKQIEVEAMNFMDDDKIRKQVSREKSKFDKVRREHRKLQQEHNKQMLSGGTEGDDVELGDMGALSKKRDRMDKQLLQNRQSLEEAKMVGNECEDMAKDIKFNLKQQNDKLENSTLKNLFEIQKTTLLSNRLIQEI